MGLIYRYYYSGTGTKKVVLKEGKYFGRPFCMMRGVTHGQPLSLTIFNIVVDAVVRACMVEVCGPQEEHHSFGWVLGKHNIVLYEDDGRISGRNPLWVKTTLKAMVRVFERVGLQTNMGKTKAMVYTPGFI